MPGESTAVGVTLGPLSRGLPLTTTTSPTHMPTRTTQNNRYIHYREYSNYPPFTAGQDTVIKSTDTRTTGSNRKNWRWLIANGESATTSLTGQRTTFTKKDGSGKVWYYYPFGSPPGLRTDVWQGCYLGQSIAVPETFDVSLWSAADLRARSSFYKKLREAQTILSGPTFLGELRESIHMIRHPAETLRAGVLDYFSVLRKRKGRGSSTFSKRKILADTWLEYSFGWSPLIHDISDASKALAATIDNVNSTMIRASGINEQDLGTLTKEASPDFVFFYYTWHRERTCKVRYIAHVENSTTGPSGSLERLGNTTGFNWSEWIPTAWELLPWSFFIDYFSNIGDVIAASITSTAGVKWVCRTDRYTGISQYTGGEHNVAKTKDFCRGGSSNYRGSSGKLGSFTYYTTRVDRSEVLTPGFPTLAFELPGRRNQFLNMAALFASARRVTPFF